MRGCFGARGQGALLERPFGAWVCGGGDAFGNGFGHCERVRGEVEVEVEASCDCTVCAGEVVFGGLHRLKMRCLARLEYSGWQWQ